MNKIPRCEKVLIHRPGDASLSCVKPAGHEARGEGPCEVAEVCPTCHGSGRTGKTVPVPAADSRTVAQAVASAKTSGYAQKLEA